jgi:outer membrane biosynthesis protein TonB
MKIIIELNTKDIASARQTEITTITDVMQAMALDRLQMQDTIPADKVVTLPETPQPEPEQTMAPAPEKPVTHKRTKKAATKEEPEGEPDAEQPQLEPAAPEKPAEPSTEINRKVVQDKLKEIAKAGKAKGIKAILKAHGVEKFSALPDSDLADVLKEAEAL